MTEVLVQFDAALPGPSGRSYVPRACGRLMEDGRRWEGWIEFVPEGTGPVLRTSKETVQPNKEDLRYWATGLTATYLDGSVVRAHVSAAGARGGQQHEALGRSRGGFGTKIHVRAEGGGKPMLFVLSGGAL